MSASRRCSHCGLPLAAWALTIRGVSVCTHYCARAAGLVDVGDHRGENAGERREEVAWEPSQG